MSELKTTVQAIGYGVLAVVGGMVLLVLLEEAGAMRKTPLRQMRVAWDALVRLVRRAIDELGRGLRDLGRATRDIFGPHDILLPAWLDLPRRWRDRKRARRQP